MCYDTITCDGCCSLAKELRWKVDDLGLKNAKIKKHRGQKQFLSEFFFFSFLVKNVHDRSVPQGNGMAKGKFLFYFLFINKRPGPVNRQRKRGPWGGRHGRWNRKGG